MFLSSKDCSRPLACNWASMSGRGTEAYHSSVTHVAYSRSHPHLSRGNEEGVTHILHQRQDAERFNWQWLADTDAQSV